MKKVTDEELQQLQKAVQAVNEGVTQVGAYEMQKRILMRDVEQAESQLKALQATLEDKYGNITVNLSTGEITDADNQKD
jgi:multidrug resistance efflux pump